jgi:hypothetical protein
VRTSTARGLRNPGISTCGKPSAGAYIAPEQEAIQGNAFSYCSTDKVNPSLCF